MNTKESTQDVYVENPEWEKTTGAHRLQLSLYENSTIRGSEATTSSSVSSPGGGYNRVSLCISLSLCTAVIHIQQYDNNSTLITHKVIALSHIYTNITFRLFTNMSSLPVLTGSVRSGFRISSSSHWVHPIRFLDLFRFSPGPLHS